MSKVRETLITNSEKKFLSKCLAEKTRLDGRAFEEFRPLEIKFGKDWGLCYTSLGKTKVLAQTSCEIQQPKSSRPSEGILNINIELSALAAPHFEPGRQSELGVQLNRLLEKCIKDSKAIDLESLCIKTKEKVWALRVDLNVVNYEGNILDCASIAMLASLAHFRRPDVSCDGEDFVIHSYQQKDPISIVIHHYPVCITYCVFNAGEHVLADPTLIEEGSADAVLTIGLNSFKELCGLHLGGKAELLPHVILSTVGKATERANQVIGKIKDAIQADAESRQNQVAIGFHVTVANDKVPEVSLDLNQTKVSRRQRKTKNKKKTVQLDLIDAASVGYVPAAEWKVDSEDDLIIVEPAKVKIDLSSDSEEEEQDVIMIN